MPKETISQEWMTVTGQSSTGEDSTVTATVDSSGKSLVPSYERVYIYNTFNVFCQAFGETFFTGATLRAIFLMP